MNSLADFAASWRHLHVLVLGAGDSGLAMARWCAERGARVSVADTREQPPQAEALARELPASVLHRGFDASLLDAEPAVLRVLKSPGLSPRDAALAGLLARAGELGIAVHNELDLFAEALAELQAAIGYAPKVIAITGTNGKTTTTVMCGQLVERSGLRVAVAGNVGPTMLDTLREALIAQRESASSPVPVDATGHDQAGAEAPPRSGLSAASEAPRARADEAAAPELGAPGDEPRAEGPREPGPATFDEAAIESPADDAAPLRLIPPPPAPPSFEHLPEAWVLELSSFQLDGVERFEPSAAVVLNLSQDHLDWHGSMASYAQAKARIHGPADRTRTIAVVNRDDPEAAALVPQPPAPAAAVRGQPKAKPPALAARRVIGFGLDAPRRAGDFGLVVENGMAWLVRAMEAEITPKRRRGESAAEAQEPPALQRLMPADALRIRGRHNTSNALAALALATAIGRPLAPMLHGLREYRGEPHRVEFVASVGGVEAFDDSKGTNVGATVAALDGLGAERGAEAGEKRLWLILGGDGKGQDFAPIAAPIARWTRGVALIGRDRAAIAAAIESAATTAGVEVVAQPSLEAAVQWCFAQARAGDAVLLSPACASFDMFRGYAHRAQVFCDTVRALALERGEAA
ncbi:MAG TPA: UDP-N-acetylmuramoyl-L-alanine--D-glutamate ligase [Methylibium sp.]|uniref:UDP-N-acetylmuramoyl-L-alanine--D-glutamate ligase n=1 Tax=Methylibium sp. TaxID=2067992 RepID=UPI002DB81A3F|nr:UDP-N-acetylmuramoyl-L-alanine--D-glutamate ligase [Methylibium sp.]HEU4460590.1 UDP-N-acetylmuramoyl-L-alanine--D-glutamate ligase [Methylibium sp.]